MDDRIKQDAAQLTRMLLPQAQAAFKGLASQPVTVPLLRLQRTLDELLAAAPTPVACSSGCSYCCHYHVMASAPEVMALAEHIEKLPAPRRAALTARVQETAARIAGMDAAAHSAAKIPCAMLEDGKCATYELRPLPCRRHHSLDVKVCEEQHAEPARNGSIPLDRARQTAALGMEVAQVMALQHEGLDTARYELHAALADALSGSGAKKRWKNGKSPFPNVREKAAGI